MVRPPKGERKRKTTTITVDPVEYALFQANVEKFLPDPSASQHLGTFIKSENARFAGQEGVSPIVDEATLERQHKTLAAKYEEIKQILEKRDAYTRAINLAVSFGITVTNGKEVIAKMLQDQDKPDSRVRKELSNSDFQLLISLLQFGAARVEAENKLGEVRRKLYLGTQPGQPEPSHEDAKPEKQEPTFNPNEVIKDWRKQEKEEEDEE